MGLLFYIAAFLAYFVKGMCGFANTIVFTTILSYSNDNINISPVEIIVTYPSNAIMAWKNRKSINVKMCVTLSVLVILGAIPGVLFLKNGSTAVIKCILGLAVCIVGIDLLCINKRKEHEQKPLILWIIGLTSGFLCGLFGIGALLASYIGRTTKDTKAFKANLNVVFFVEATFRVIIYVVSGIITFAALKNAILLMPCMIAGLFAGIFLSEHINEKIVKKLIIILLIISGLVLFTTNI